MTNVSCYAFDGLRHVISGILAGGSLVPHGSLLLRSLEVWPCDFVVPFVSAAVTCHGAMFSLLH